MYEVGQQGLMEGPYDLLEAAAGAEASQEGIEARVRAIGLPKQKYSHFVYVCRKAERV